MLNLGRVTAIHPDAHTVDLEMIEDGRKVTSVKVMSGSASFNTGMNDLAEPDAGDNPERVIIAVVSYFKYVPVVMGFLFPEVSQMLFPDKERMIYRHASDVYGTIDGKGNFELAHPSGAFVRIGETSGHEDLTGKDYDKKWAIKKNKARKVHVHIEIPGAVSLNMSPGGQVDLTCSGAVNVTAGGAATVKAPSVTLNTPMTHCTGQLVVDAKITGKGGFAFSGGAGGGGGTVSGSITVTEDVTASGISLKSHTHTEQGDGAAVSAPQ